MTATGAYTKLLQLLNRLEQSSIHYSLARNTPNAIMVLIAVPGERWEVEIDENGNTEVEVFVSRRGVEAEDAIGELFKRFTD